MSTFKNVRKELQELKAENGTKNMDTRIIASANSLGLNRRKGREMQEDRSGCPETLVLKTWSPDGHYIRIC